jgi:hypothetical protein
MFFSKERSFYNLDVNQSHDPVPLLDLGPLLDLDQVLHPVLHPVIALPPSQFLSHAIAVTIYVKTKSRVGDVR